MIIQKSPRDIGRSTNLPIFLSFWSVKLYELNHILLTERTPKIQSNKSNLIK